MSGFPAIDAHQHFWDPARVDYAFLTDELEPIRRAFGPDDLRPHLATEGIAATLLVQTRSSLDETREFLVLAALEPFIGGVVGWVDLTAADVAHALAVLRASPVGEHLLAIRHQVHDEPDADWLRRSDVRRGLAAVEAADLAYDLLVRTREMPAAIDTVRAFPGLRFVLDHLAKPPIASGDLSAWAPAILALAELPNVTAKISGLVTEADWRSWSIDDLRGPVELVVDAFGPSRLMLGSDWPVCLLAGAYGDVLGATRELLAELSAADRDDILGATAARAYRIDVGLPVQPSP
ncbi:amidohydrolase family protein [soil metagenome]